MSDDYDGMTVIDVAGETVGKVERTYVDDDDVARVIEVRTGHLMHKHHLVPADGAQSTDDGLRVPYTLDTIEESPNVGAEDTLEGDTLQTIRSYYDSVDGAALAADDGDTAATAQTPAAGALATTEEDSDGEGDAGTSTAQPANIEALIGNATSGEGISAGEIRDLGDVIEIPILEEVLVKQTRVREVLRIRKSRVTETQTFSGDVRKESVEVVSADGVPVQDNVTGESS